jgi:hypothetical protein
MRERKAREAERNGEGGPGHALRAYAAATPYGIRRMSDGRRDARRDRRSHIRYALAAMKRFGPAVLALLGCASPEARDPSTSAPVDVAIAPVATVSAIGILTPHAAPSVAVVATAAPSYDAAPDAKDDDSGDMFGDTPLLRDRAPQGSEALGDGRSPLRNRRKRRRLQVEQRRIDPRRAGRRHLRRARIRDAELPTTRIGHGHGELSDHVLAEGIATDIERTVTSPGSPSSRRFRSIHRAS